jgi:hypothetical protein
MFPRLALHSWAQVFSDSSSRVAGHRSTPLYPATMTILKAKELHTSI